MKSTLNDLKPVRKIRPSSRSITGKFASSKTNTTHYFESSLERDYLTLLEYDPEVDMFLTQPISIFYTLQGESRRYTPDVLVHYNEELKRKPMLVEIKYAAELELKKAELQPRFDAAMRYADERSFIFDVITELQIRTVYLDNLKFLSRYKSPFMNNVMVQQIDGYFKSTNSITAGELVTGNNPQFNARMIHTLWQLLAAGIFACDIQSKITMTTELWINNH